MKEPRYIFGMAIGLIIPLLLLWTVISTFIMLGQGDVEGLLESTFRHHVPHDAFFALNRIIPIFWASLTILLTLAFLATRQRRTDVVLILLAGPILAFLLCVISEDKSDPNWYDILAISTIACFVSALVSCCYWSIRRQEKPFM